MTDIEQKALALLNEVLSERHECLHEMLERDWSCWTGALCRAIERHEAFRQEVSDVASVCAQHFCENSWTVGDRQDHVDMLSRFIIPAAKPDPLVAVLEKMGWYIAPNGPTDAENFRAALEARGLEIREKNNV